jgi:predicted Zn finger-like uncharacterized protein
MALATKCPQCGALFRVVADQLKLRGGLVRCGQCRAVFDAISSLTYVDDAALAQTRTVSALTRPASPPPAPNGEPPAVVAARQMLGPATTLRISPSAPATLAGGLPARVEDSAALRKRAKAAARVRSERKIAPASIDASEAGVPTLLAPDLGRAAPAPAPDGIEVVEIAAPPGPTIDDEDESVSDTAPSFARKRSTPRGFSIVFGGGTLLLLALALVQLAVIFRGEIMVHWPQSRLTLVDLCSVFHCAVTWPTRADQLAVIGTELQALPGTDALELTAVVRNRAAFRQALPAVEVTLTDPRNQALARKVFTPADYLASAGEPSSRIDEGIGPGSDMTIRIFFEARGLQPSGFLVYPFYL